MTEHDTSQTAPTLPPTAPGVPDFQLLENLPVGVALYRAVREHGRIVDFVAVKKNREFLAVAGLDSALGSGHFERFPDAKSSHAAARFLETIQSVMDKGCPETVETYTPSAARSYRFDIAPTGSPEHFLIVLRKITDQLESDRQLKRLLKEQEFLFESQSIGYWKSINRVFSWTNAAFDQMLGYQRHELLGKSSRTIHASEASFEAIGHALRDPQRPQTSLHVDTRFVRKDGHIGCYEVVLQQIIEGDDVTLIGSCIDRSSEHAALLALKKSELRLQTCLKGSGAVYFDWDLPSGEVEFDQSIQTMLGITPACTYEALLSLVHRADREIVQHYADSHLGNDVALSSCEFRMRNTSGQWLWVLLRASVVESDPLKEHAPLRMAGTLTDVTASKRIEREAKQLLDRLEHLLKERNSPHETPAQSVAAASRVSELSRRQTQVLRLIASGNTSTEIAERLHISEATVQSHRKEIMQKLGQKNIATLTRFAIEAGIL